jgi:universal stress protein A
MLMPTRILVPTDFSEHSDKALKQALDIAREYKAKVFVTHVIAVIRPEFENVLRWEAQERLRNQLDRVPRAGSLDVATDVRTGIVYEEILKESEEKGIDLIVIASLGQSGIAKYLVGGVARNVLKGSKCPVLLTR